MEQGIKIKTSEVGAMGDIALVRVQGFVDTNTCMELRKAIDDILLQSSYNLVFDLGAVNYVSSAGWGVFVGEIRTIRESGGDLRIVQMMPDVYEVFEMLEFNRILSYYDNIEEAINDFDITMGYDIARSVRLKARKPSQTDLTIPKIGRESVVPADKNERTEKARKNIPKPKVNEANLPLVEKIRILIIDNPLNSLLEIRKLLNERRFGYTKIGPLRLYRILKRNNWETETKRARFYRSR